MMTWMISTVCSMADCRSHLNHKTFVESDHEIVSKVIPSVQLIQEVQLSVTGKSMG